MILSCSMESTKGAYNAFLQHFQGSHRTYASFKAHRRELRRSHISYPASVAPARFETLPELDTIDPYLVSIGRGQSDDNRIKYWPFNLVRSSDGETLPLSSYAESGHEAIMQLLLAKESALSRRTPGMVGRRCRGPPREGTRPSSSCLSRSRELRPTRRTRVVGLRCRMPPRVGTTPLLSCCSRLGKNDASCG